ncbi:MAG: hypothetical protein LBU64_07670 [Planctomycetota bacterium]|nr:hypothetical protein [Planctomycetota bacterium]
MKEIGGKELGAAIMKRCKSRRDKSAHEIKAKHNFGYEMQPFDEKLIKIAAKSKVK